MFARYFFLILGVISLGWIGYVSLDLIDKNETLSAEQLFGKEDQKIMIIQRVDEVSNLDSMFKIPLSIKNFYQTISTNLPTGSTLYISQKRSHFLIDAQQFWTIQHVKKLIQSSEEKLISSENSSGKTSHFSFEFYKGKIYFFKEKSATNSVKNWGNFDKKSSAVIIDFSAASPKQTELYLTKGNQFAYKTKTITHFKCNQINDKELFSSILPLSFKNYHFYEKEYFKTIDKTFANSIFSKWMDKGFVSISYKGNLVLVSDYKIGQNPIENLEELTNFEGNTINDEGYFKGIKLSSTFPFKNGFYVFNLNDAVVISATKTICEDIVALNKIGKTLATEQELLQTVYGDMPRDVTERFSNSKVKYTKSIYNNQLFETHLLHRNLVATSDTSDLTGIKPSTIKSISMAVQGEIVDFKVLEGKGNVAVITNHNQFYYFSGGNLSWKKAISGKMLKEIVYSKENDAFVITSDKAIQLFAKNGTELLKSQDDLSEKVAAQAGTVVTSKGQLHLIYPTQNGQLIVLNAKGKQAFKLKGLTDCTKPLLAWKSSNKQLVAVQNGQQLKIIDIDRKQALRTIPVSSKAIAKIIDNELLIFNGDGNNLTLINQKGGVVSKSSIINGSVFVSEGPSEIALSVLQNHTIQGITKDGANPYQLKSNISSIDWVSYSKQNGKTIYAVVDGLDNNIVLYNGKGEIISKEQIEGSIKCMLKQEGNQLIVSTIVDNFIVQYRINQ
jgi:hypothetical protein